MWREGIPAWRKGSDVSVAENLPDYLNDLNAMYGAEKILSREQRWAYLDALQEIAGKLSTDEWDAITASAIQRAEAFLKSLSLWKD